MPFPDGLGDGSGTDTDSGQAQLQANANDASGSSYPLNSSCRPCPLIIVVLPFLLLSRFQYFFIKHRGSNN
jgi:hypothetical protein